jgi:hypothetical protein
MFLGLFAPILALADSTVERELSFRWDALRFALGELTSDNYGQTPLIVVYRTAEGGMLIIYNSNKPVTRTLKEAEIEAIVSRLKVFFSGAGEAPPVATQRQPPAFDMQLSIDEGFSRRTFLKVFNTQKAPFLIREFSKYISDLSGRK